MHDGLADVEHSDDNAIRATTDKPSGHRAGKYANRAARAFASRCIAPELPHGFGMHTGLYNQDIGLGLHV